MNDEFRVKHEERRKREEEIEANHFAMCLLMPEDFIRRDLAEIKKNKELNNEIISPEKLVKRLAKKYEVPEVAMTLRLANLGFLQPG